MDEGPARILAIAEAKVIEADPVAHTARIEANKHKKGVWYPRPRPGSQTDHDDTGNNTAGLGVVYARIDEAGALAHARMVEDLATALADHAPTGTTTITRAEFQLLEHQALVLADDYAA